MSLANYVPFALLFLTLTTISRGYAQRKLRKLPPGPKPLPLIGNALQMPLKNAWVTYALWKEKYGDIVYVSIFGRPAIILNSAQVCVDLLDKRSAIYSDRPNFEMLNLQGWGWNLGQMHYSNRWREHRRLFQQFFNEKASKSYLDIQSHSTHAFLVHLLEEPQHFLQHIRLYFAQTFFHVLYGIRVDRYEDAFVQLAEKGVATLLESAIPGRYLVDIFPSLKYIPTWMPGAGFQQEAISVQPLAQEIKDVPAEHAMERRHEDAEVSASAFVSMLEQCERESETKEFVESPIEMAKNSAGIAYLGGADTTLSSIQAFFLAMANNPDVQKVAQAELDSVLGSGRLPTFEDEDSLPYIRAILNEVLRWHTVLPISVVHCTTQEDEYRGYYIPKGTIIIPNTWLFLHDPSVYPDPHLFKPSRWLVDTLDGIKFNNKIPTPDVAFGYGRRVCPGQHFARNSLFIAISSVLSCFDIAPLDESGQPCAPSADYKMTDGLLVYPLPYKVSITPRSDKAVQLIKELVV